MQAEKEIKIVERENFSGGNSKVIKQFIVLERYLHFPGHSEEAQRLKNLCLNNNATEIPHLYYGFYYVENFFQNFFKNSSRITELFGEFSVYCIEVQKFNEKFE